VILLLLFWAAQAAGKTLWEYLEILIIPSVLGAIALLFNRAAKKREMDIALDNQRQETMRAYFDRMSELLLRDGLRKSKKGSEVRSVARARTLSVFRILDGERKGQVLKFLYESALIIGNNPVIPLEDADLTMINLRKASLDGINLHRTYLHKAHLVMTHLLGAHLVGAQLNDANLDKAWLSDADLLGVHLNNASLDGALLSCANLCAADLSGANLRNARLNGVGLAGATLKGAVLNGANLKEACVSPKDLLEASSLDNATLPDRTKYEEWVARGMPDWGRPDWTKEGRQPRRDEFGKRIGKNPRM